jgi:hypothetical protein
VYPVKDPLLLRKFGSAGNRTRTLLNEMVHIVTTIFEVVISVSFFIMFY